MQLTEWEYKWIHVAKYEMGQKDGALRLLFLLQTSHYKCKQQLSFLSTSASPSSNQQPNYQPL